MHKSTLAECVAIFTLVLTVGFPFAVRLGATFAVSPPAPSPFVVKPARAPAPPATFAPYRPVLPRQERPARPARVKGPPGGMRPSERPGAGLEGPSPSTAPPTRRPDVGPSAVPASEVPVPTLLPDLPEASAPEPEPSGG